MSIVALFTITRIWKQPKYPSTEEWIKKMWNIYTIEYYSDHKKNKQTQNCAICRDMDGPRNCHTEWSQKEKNKYHILIYIYVESRETVQTNLSAKQK